MARPTAWAIRCLARSRDEVGPARHAAHAGKDWTDPEVGRQSMILMAEGKKRKLMP